MTKKYTPMIEQYLKIKAEVPDAFLFFRLGDFYEMFFEDAKKAAEELEITLTSRDGGKERVPMCGVPYHSAQSYIERLITKGYKVAICEQVEDPSEAKGVVKREIVQIITPGTVMDEAMLTPQENNFLVSLVYEEEKYALAAVDLSTGEIHLTELPNAIGLVRDELFSYWPKEVVIDEKNINAMLRKELQKQRKIMITPFPLADQDREQLMGELERQFPQLEEVCSSNGLLNVLMLLFAYLRQTQKRVLHHLHRLHRYDPEQYMLINEIAKKNLECFQTLEEGKKKGSLLWVLDRTATAMGGRLLKRWLDKPLIRIEAIRARQEAVRDLLHDRILLDELKEVLKQIYDLERLSAKVAFGTANARDLKALQTSLSQIPKLRNRLLEYSSSRLNQWGQSLDVCTDICELIAKAIVDDPPISVKEGGLIKEGYDAELDRLFEIQKKGKDWIAKLEQREREETGIKSLKVGYNRVFGYYIEVTKSNLRYLPEGRYIRKQTLANSERFVTPELKKQEQQILQAEEQSVEKEYQIFTQIRTHIAKEVPRLQRLAEKIAKLDVLHAFATVADQYHYVQPTIHQGEELIITEGRHPVVEAVLTDETFVANDVHLDATDRQILLVTGPNMAGKSTYMRQVALIVIMAQMGSFVPASYAKIPIIDRIFTRIGAVDDLAGGRSTFMVEMAETCHALKHATPRSLILLDEVGRGTSTYDGMALAQAIIEYIHHFVGAKTLFSTHYHELIQLEEELPRLVNVHAECVERDGKVEFMHRIAPGGADRSYGIHVAELAELPDEVIERARVLLTSLEDRSTEKQNSKAEKEENQLNLFEWNEERVNGSIRSDEEEEVLQSIREWDLMNRTPFETMQFLQRCKQRLSSAQNGRQRGGGMDGRYTDIK